MIKNVINCLRNRASLLKFSIILNLLLTFYITVDLKGSKSEFTNKFLRGSSIRTLNFASVESGSSLYQLQSDNKERDIRKNTKKNEDTEKSWKSIGYKPFLNCNDKDTRFRIGNRGKYLVLYNYLEAKKKFHCDESITYTTHGDVSFLDNLVPLLERWRGPLSIGIYAPGTDFITTIKAIVRYRHCFPIVTDYVNFHIFFDDSHIPILNKGISNIIDRSELINLLKDSDTLNCDKPPQIINGTLLYKARMKLDYPVNVARNVARIAATTHYIFASDIELYPSPGTIPAFLEMIRRNGTYVSRPNPKVFVNSIFEIRENVTLPNNKHELIKLIKSKDVIKFHQKICSLCHAIPNSSQWFSNPIQDGMNVFHVAKRYAPHSHWEPIYIGTNDEPLYDERLSWEGRSDKMTQGFQLCLMDYEFHILDNAFLIHRPGIKQKTKAKKSDKVIIQDRLIYGKILQEITTLYGTRKGCEK